jgi:hypothetical protein
MEFIELGSRSAHPDPGGWRKGADPDRSKTQTGSRLGGIDGPLIGEGKDTDAALLDRVFFALSDPLWWPMLDVLPEAFSTERLTGGGGFHHTCQEQALRLASTR